MAARARPARAHRADLRHATGWSVHQAVGLTGAGRHVAARGIDLESDFLLERVDLETKALVSFDEGEVPFDLLVTVPINMGAGFVGRSGLGDELRHVKVDPHTLLADNHDNVFALGDATNLPTSKAGSVAHFAVDVLVHNLLGHLEGRPMIEASDGHANCFIESGDGKALLLDFNYDTEPLLGHFPLPGLGPLTLLSESQANHLGKLAFPVDLLARPVAALDERLDRIEARLDLLLADSRAVRRKWSHSATWPPRSGSWPAR